MCGDLNVANNADELAVILLFNFSPSGRSDKLHFTAYCLK